MHSQLVLLVRLGRIYTGHFQPYIQTVNHKNHETTFHTEASATLSTLLKDSPARLEVIKSQKNCMLEVLSLQSASELRCPFQLS
jgi:hypothetical protein